MSKKLGTEADSFNNAETKKDCHDPSRGGIPRIIRDPIRKRAYHRALKRGEHWALFRQSWNNIVNWINSEMFKDVMYPNKLLVLSQQLDTKESYEVKIEYGSKLPENK